MRLPGRGNSCPSDTESDNEDEYPESKAAAEDDHPDYGNSQQSSSYLNINFRHIHRGTTIDYQEEDGNWYAAEVKKIDRRNRKMFISFLNAGEMFDKWIVFDNKIARINTYTYDNYGNFKVGQMIEFCEGTVWKKGVITAVSAETNRVQVTVHQSYEIVWINSPRMNIRAMTRQPVRNFRRWKIPTATPGWRNPGPSSVRENINRETHTRQISEFSDRYSHYIQAIEKMNLHVVQVNGDGNCLFRSVAHQIYGDEDLHELVRDYCLNYMEADAVFFSQFVEGGEQYFSQYLSAKRTLGCWGDDPEIQALCEIYDRPAEIFAYDPVHGARKLRTFHEAVINLENVRPSSSSTHSYQRPFIKLSYYGGGHYDSIVDNSHHNNIIPAINIGKIERAAIQRCGQRRGTADLYVGLEDTKKITDTEATDRAALDLAIQISRHDHLGWATSDDVEACLRVALEMAPTAGLAPTVSDVKTSSPRIANAHITSEYLHDTASDLIAVQNDLMKTVAEQSEREYLEKEILSSFHTLDDSKLTEDELLEQAKLVSLKLNNTGSGFNTFHEHVDGKEAKQLSLLNEEEMLHLAIQKSLSEKPHSSYYASTASDRKLGLDKDAIASKGSSKGLNSSMDEDAMMQAAIQESLRGVAVNTTSRANNYRKWSILCCVKIFHCIILYCITVCKIIILYYIRCYRFSGYEQ